MSTNFANPMSAGNQSHAGQGQKNQDQSKQDRSEEQKGGMGSAIASKAEEAGTLLADKASQAGQYVSDQASKLASSAMHSMEGTGAYVGQKADDARHSMGSGIKSMGEQLKNAAPEGMMHDAACSLASSLESTGQYLEEHGLSAMTEDLTNVIKRNPLPSVFIAAGVGFLLAKACTSSRSSY
jgi:hypothetical protein